MSSPGGSSGALAGLTPTNLQNGLTARSAWAFIPDVWFRLNVKKFSLELEGVLVAGNISTVSDQLSTAPKNGLQILQGGFVGRMGYSLLRDALHIAVEVGYASGDQSEDLAGTARRWTVLLHRTAPWRWLHSSSPARSTGNSALPQL